MKELRLTFAIILVALVATSSIGSASDRLPAGTPVVVFLETAGNLPEPDPGPPTDMLVLTGGRTFRSVLPDCTDGEVPVQNAVLVDTEGAHSSRLVTVYVQGDIVIPPGTRLGDFVSGVSCTSNGIGYRKFSTVVQ